MNTIIDAVCTRPGILNPPGAPGVPGGLPQPQASCVRQGNSPCINLNWPPPYIRPAYFAEVNAGDDANVPIMYGSFVMFHLSCRFIGFLMLRYSFLVLFIFSLIVLVNQSTGKNNYILFSILVTDINQARLFT